MKIRTRPTEAEAIRWEGQRYVGPTDDWLLTKGYTVKVNVGGEIVDRPSLDALPDDVVTPNGIEYLTDVIGTDMVRLSGHGLRVLTSSGWAPVNEGDFIVRAVDGTLAVLSTEQFQASYEATP